MSGNDQSVDAEKIEELLKTAKKLFISEEKVSEKIEEVITKFERGFPVFLEKIHTVIVVIKENFENNICSSSPDWNYKVSKLIVELNEATGRNWLVREKDD